MRATVVVLPFRAACEHRKAGRRRPPPRPYAGCPSPVAGESIAEHVPSDSLDLLSADRSDVGGEPTLPPASSGSGRASCL